MLLNRNPQYLGSATSVFAIPESFPVNLTVRWKAATPVTSWTMIVLGVASVLKLVCTSEFV